MLRTSTYVEEGAAHVQPRRVATTTVPMPSSPAGETQTPASSGGLDAGASEAWHALGQGPAWVSVISEIMVH